MSANQSVHLTCSRTFNWIPSCSENSDVLSQLNEKMAWFYGQQEGRSRYQDMIETAEQATIDDRSVRHLMPKYLCDLNPTTVLEVGCADGRLYRQLKSYGCSAHYSGIEIAEYLIERNRTRHPEANWTCANAYQIPFSDSSFDLCFSLYVLEHLVYPEQALKEMLRVVRPGGRLLLVFPDFLQSGRFPSQLLGFSPGRASQKLKVGKLLDAALSLYDSRVRLPNALKQSRQKVGMFPINCSPLCLSYPSFMEADVDAIYIASKQEVYQWAIAQGYRAEYPYGTEGEFAEQAFIAIEKT